MVSYIEKGRSLSEFENRNLRRIFGLKRDNGEGSTMRNFIVCSAPLILSV